MDILAVVVALVFFAAIFYILWYLYYYFMNSKPSKNRIEKDVDELRKELNPWITTLVPWTDEEMSLLSLNQSEEFIRKRPVAVKKGILYSIYNEPLVAYAIKEYPGKKYSLLYARISDREYVYRIKPNETEIYLNNKAFARLKNDELYDTKGKKVIARLHADSSSHLPVIIDNEEVGQVSNKEKIDSVNPRAFEFLHDMDDHNQAKFLALSLHEILLQKEEK